MGCDGVTGSEVVQNITTLKVDVGKLGKFTNGTELETVNLGGVATPTIRGMVVSINSQANGQRGRIQARADAQNNRIQGRADEQYAATQNRAEWQYNANQVRADEQNGRIQGRADAQYDQIQNRADGAVAIATGQAVLAARAADRSCDCAAASRLAAEQAANAAQGITGFADAAQCFFCFRLEGTEVVLYVPDEGETIIDSDYDFVTNEPASARFYMEGSSLIFELPYTKTAAL